MKEFWIDFSGYLKIKADSSGEAIDKFWKFVNNIDLSNSDLSDDVWDVDAIEEVKI